MSKFTKKSLAVLIITVLLSSLIPNLISYAADPTITAILHDQTNTSTSANIGDTVSVDFKLENGLSGYDYGFAMTLQYDTEYLEALTDFYDQDGDGDYSDNMSSEIFPQTGNRNAMYGLSQGNKIAFTYTSGYGYFNTSALLGTLNFKILKAGTTTINVVGAQYIAETGEEVEITNLGSFTISVPVPMTGLTATETNATLKVGETTQMSAVKTPADTTDTTAITYTSSNTAVATVDSQGKVTAVSNGTAQITAKCGNYTAVCGTVTVVTPLTSVTLDKTAVTLHRGVTETASLIPTVNANVTKEVTYSYSIDKQEVATVDTNGTITAVGNGTAVVTVTAKSTDPVTNEEITKTATCNVTVDTPLSGLTLVSTETLAFEIGEDPTTTPSQQMVVSKNPTDTTDTSVITYTSSNTAVATVDSNGNVTAVSKGEATITASCAGKTVSCKAVVTMPVTSVKITNGDISDLKVSQQATLNVEIGPEGAADVSAIKWEIVSSNPVKTGKDVIKLENGVITAINPGTAVIKASYLSNETIYDEITVTVPEVKATSLVMNKINTEIEKGSEETLTVTVLPEDTTDDLEVTWTSDDEKIVAVDSQGKVTAVASGETTIRAQMNGLEATCDVKVICTLQSITLNEDKVSLVIKGTDEVTETLSIVKNPIDADAKVEDATWESSVPEVATVDDQGKVTAVAPGTTYITATLDGKTARCEVVVDAELTSVTIENESTDLEVYKNKTGEMKPVLDPSNATIVPTATWSSDDEKIATVDQNGVVKGISAGTATITVEYKFEDGRTLTASRDVVVKEVKATGVTITQKPESVLKNEESVLEIEVSKDSETEELTDEIYWSSSDDGIAYVVYSEGTYKVVGVKEGTATITVTVGNYSDTFDVEVKEVHIESLKAGIEGTTVTEGNQAKINITVNPENSTDDKTFTYTVDNESVAKVVIENGIAYVKGLNPGTAIVTVTAENGVKTSFEVAIAAKENVSTGTSNGGGVGAAVGAVTEAATSLVGSPHTGDMNIIALSVMAIISLAGMIITIKKK